MSCTRFTALSTNSVAQSVGCRQRPYGGWVSQRRAPAGPPLVELVETTAASAGTTPASIHVPGLSTFRPQPECRNPLSTTGFRTRANVGGQCWNKTYDSDREPPPTGCRVRSPTCAPPSGRWRRFRCGRWTRLRPPPPSTECRPRRPSWPSSKPGSWPTPTGSRSPPRRGCHLDRELARPHHPGPAGSRRAGRCGSAQGLEDHDLTRTALAAGRGPRRAGRGHPPRPRATLPDDLDPDTGRARPSAHLLDLAADHDAKALQAPGQATSSRSPAPRPPTPTKPPSWRREERDAAAGHPADHVRTTGTARSTAGSPSTPSPARCSRSTCSPWPHPNTAPPKARSVERRADPRAARAGVHGAHRALPRQAAPQGRRPQRHRRGPHATSTP